MKNTKAIIIQMATVGMPNPQLQHNKELQLKTQNFVYKQKGKAFEKLIKLLNAFYSNIYSVQLLRNNIYGQVTSKLQKFKIIIAKSQSKLQDQTVTFPPIK